MSGSPYVSESAGLKRPRAVGADENLINTEYSLASNWFINGHRNKITVDLSWLDAEEDDETASELLFRLQWDLSI